MSVCAVQLKRKLMLHRNNSRMLKAASSPTTSQSVYSRTGYTTVETPEAEKHRKEQVW
jgi:hypothetical protein